jgi:hypothetical protein
MSDLEKSRRPKGGIDSFDEFDRLRTIERSGEWKTPLHIRFADLLNEACGLANARSYTRISQAIGLWGEKNVRRWGVEAAEELGKQKIAEWLVGLSAHNQVHLSAVLSEKLDSETAPVTATKVKTWFEYVQRRAIRSPNG